MVEEYHIRRDIQSHDLSSILKYFLNSQPSPHVNLFRLLMNCTRQLLTTFLKTSYLHHLKAKVTPKRWELKFFSGSFELRVSYL
jgi:hypothetical protein